MRGQDIEALLGVLEGLGMALLGFPLGDTRD